MALFPPGPAPTSPMPTPNQPLTPSASSHPITAPAPCICVQRARRFVCMTLMTSVSCLRTSRRLVLPRLQKPCAQRTRERPPPQPASVGRTRSDAIRTRPRLPCALPCVSDCHKSERLSNAHNNRRHAMSKLRNLQRRWYPASNQGLLLSLPRNRRWINTRGNYHPACHCSRLK